MWGREGGEGVSEFVQSRTNWTQKGINAIGRAMNVCNPLSLVAILLEKCRFDWCLFLKERLYYE